MSSTSKFCSPLKFIIQPALNWRMFFNAGSSTEIVGSPDIYFFPGTLVNLTCVVTSPTQPGRIFWYHQVNPPSLTY
jgi:hypothetical protein